VKLRQFYVYVTTNASLSTLYIGVTGDLSKRIWQHREAVTPTFTEKYNVNRLIYFEIWDTAEQAIAREKQLKNWRREWKLNLIRECNPGFEDLSSIL